MDPNGSEELTPISKTTDIELEAEILKKAQKIFEMRKEVWSDSMRRSCASFQAGSVEPVFFSPRTMILFVLLPSLDQG